MPEQSISAILGGITYIAACEVRRRLGMSQGGLAQWCRTGCPYLGGESLICINPHNDDPTKARAWYEEQQIERIAKAMKDNHEEFTYSDGVYLTYKRAWSRHKMPRSTLQRLAKVGRILTRKRAFLSGGRGKGKFEQTLYHERGIVEYKRGRTARWDGVSVDDGGQSLSLTAAARESGICRQQLWKHIQRGELSAELRNPPPGQRGRGRPMYAIARQHLRDFCARLRTESRQRVPPRWESESQISNRLGLNLEQRIALSIRLREWRNCGSLHSIWIRRSNAPRRRVWHYDPREVTALLAQPAIHDGQQMPLETCIPELPINEQNAQHATEQATKGEVSQGAGESIVMPAAYRSDHSNDDPACDGKLQDINPYNTRISEFSDKALGQIRDVIYAHLQTPFGNAPVVLGATWKDPAIVQGVRKKLSSPAKWKVIKVLLEAGPEGLGKDSLEEKVPSARQQLNELRMDPDWMAILPEAKTKGGGYRLQW